MTEEIFRYFPSSLRKELEAETSFPMAEELRLRAGKRAMFYAEGEEHILRMRPDKQEIADILLALSQHSLHSFSDELRQGFFTMEGGIRIGVAGKAVSERGSIRLIRSFSSMNIRFPREKVGVQKKLEMCIRDRYGKNMPFTFANLEDIDIFVTDDDICEEAAKLITDSGAVLL